MKRSPFCNEVIRKAHPLKKSNLQNSLEPLINSIKDKKIVMLGESSHGTKEFYELRSLISKELILNHGFNFISVEGDWPACQLINQFIQLKDASYNGHKAKSILSQFSRWPTWMWANEEIAELITWLKTYNYSKKKPAGFYGFDVYSLYDSIEQVISLLSKIEPELAIKAKSYYACFESYRHNEMAYARSLFNIPEGCKKSVLSVLNETLKYKLDKINNQSEIMFDALQNARIVSNAERYYRAMIFGEEDSWNVRDHHMMNTLSMLLDHYGHDAKGIVWAHNTHIGDYKATNMVMEGQVNVGGLAREIYGKDQVALVGLSTYSGRVIASGAWDGPIEVLPIPKAKDKSVESEFHNAILKIGFSDFYITMDNESEFSPLAEIHDQRAIGVVYHPPSEQHGNYVPTNLSKRYDAFIFFDETTAINPLNIKASIEKIPETYPFGTHI
jgi:erythromycin esterase-like protein